VRSGEPNIDSPVIEAITIPVITSVSVGNQDGFARDYSLWVVMPL
jgi:hypothetical protein